MLERVSPSAECAAHHILRHLEGPVRSHRYLGASFWRHGSSQLEGSLWWTSYLESVRDRNCVLSPRAGPSNTGFTTLLAQRFQKTKLLPNTNRTFSHTHFDVQQASAQAPYQQETDLRPQGTSGGEDSRHEKQEEYIHDGGAEPIENEIHHKMEPRQPKRRIDRLRAEWEAFIQSGRDKQQALILLRRFGTSNNVTELDYALRAYECLPKDFRTGQDCTTAVNAAIKLDRYSIAIQVIKEASPKDRDEKTLIKLLALCISKNFWNTAADLWHEVNPSQTYRFKPAPANHGLKTRSFAGMYAAHFDTITDLPSKLGNLLNQLSKPDPILNTRRNALIDLYRNMVRLVIKSERIMSTIEPKELLSLLSGPQQLGLNDQLHFGALTTLHRLPNKKTRSQLAFLIYNHFHNVAGSGFVPKAIFRLMLSFSSIGKQPPKTYQSLLEDYRRIYSHTDDYMHIEVMKACAVQGAIEDVLAVFEDFYQHGLSCGPEHIDPLIRVYANIGDSRNAQLQFNRIRAEFNFEPAAKNWNSLLIAYVRSNQPELAYIKFEEMCRSGTKPDQYSWSIVVAIAAKRGDKKHAFSLMQNAREAGISPPVAMIGAVADSCLMNARPDQALSLAMQATEVSKTTKESPVRVWNSLFRYYAFKSDSAAILKTQQKMKELGVKADSMTYAALMTALVVQGRTSDAAQILRTLHFSQDLSANEVHYSILIHGFVMEKKTEHASIIYRELLEHFPRASPSAKLSMLYLEGIQAEEMTKKEFLAGNVHHRPDFRSLLSKVDSFISDINVSDLASNAPNPGFSRRSVRGDLKDTFLGSLVSFLQRNHANDTAEKILELTKEWTNASDSQSSLIRSSWRSTLNNATQELENSVASHNWSAVSTIWDKINAVVMKHCTALTPNEQNPMKWTGQPAQAHKTELIANETRFSNMISGRFEEPEPSGKSLQVLSAHRYVLSRHLSQYIKALDKQGKYSDIIDAVRKFRGRGFRLSSKNWNSLIQALCRSPSIDHGVMAYELFQRFLFSHAPSLDTIRRGKWIQPSLEVSPSKLAQTKVKDKRENRKAIENRNPGFPIPSYYTMVHLAIVWLRASRLASQGDHTIRRRLQDRAYRTVKLVLKTPYFRDRVQGVLLRGRRVIGDPIQQPHKAIKASGLTTSKESNLLVENIAQEDLTDLQALLNLEDDQTVSEGFAEVQPVVGQKHGSSRLSSAEVRSGFNATFNQANFAKCSLGTKSNSERLEDLGATENEMSSSIIKGDSEVLPELDTTTSSKPENTIIRQMAEVLRRSSSEPLHPPVARSAGQQRGSIRTHALAQRHWVRKAPQSSSTKPRRKGNGRPLSQVTAKLMFKATSKTKKAGATSTMTRRPKPFLLSRLALLAKHSRNKVEALRARHMPARYISRSMLRRINRFESKANRMARILNTYRHGKQPKSPSLLNRQLQPDSFRIAEGES